MSAAIFASAASESCNDCTRSPMGTAVIGLQHLVLLKKQVAAAARSTE